MINSFLHKVNDLKKKNDLAKKTNNNPKKKIKFLVIFLFCLGF